MSGSALLQLESQLNVDIDSYAPEVASSLPFCAHDATSNQGFILAEMSREENAPLVLRMVQESLARNKDAEWEGIYDRIVAGLAAKITSLIQGRVLVQVSPQHAYDLEKTLDHARSYAAAFEEVGIDKNNFCIKLPSTGPALNAAKILLKEDEIQTLGTALFSVPQAIAASQAGCLYISPYFNEIAAHFDTSLVPQTIDPALDHPNAARMVHIAETYRLLELETGKRQPGVKAASFLTPYEPLFFGELLSHSATIPAPILTLLSSTPYSPSLSELPHKTSTNIDAAKPVSDSKSPLPAIPTRLRHHLKLDPLSPGGKVNERELERWRSVDWLADGGVQLQKFIDGGEAGGETKRRLEGALKYFLECEDKSRVLIEQVMQQVREGKAE